MMKAATFSNQDVALLEEEFLATIDLVSEVYGDLAFLPYDRTRQRWARSPQKTFFDAVMVGTSQHLDNAILIARRRQQVLDETVNMFERNDDGTFTGRANTKNDILTRITIFSEMLAHCVY